MVNIKNKKIPCRVLYKKRGALARRKNTLKRKKNKHRVLPGFCLPQSFVLSKPVQSLGLGSTR
jgi:hypothetical protein